MVRLLHNETVNIWSHLLGFLYLAALFFRDVILVLPSTENGLEVTRTDFFILFLLILCYQVRLDRPPFLPILNPLCSRPP